MNTFKIQEAKSMIQKALAAHNAGARAMDAVPEVLLWSEVREGSQGLEKISSILTDESIRINEWNSSFGFPSPIGYIDGCGAHAMPVVHSAMNQAVENVKAHGVSVIGIRGTKSSSGALGYYTEHIARQGYVGILFSSVMALVTPPEGDSTRVIGTNPISIAIPYRKPIVLDVSTSAMSFFGIVQANNNKETLPPGIAVSPGGVPCYNPAHVFNGTATLLPRAGAFGWGFGVMTHFLAGIMAGDGQWGHLLIAFDPVRFGVEPSTIHDRITPFVQKAEKAGGAMPGSRSASRAEGKESVVIPDRILALMRERE